MKVSSYIVHHKHRNKKPTDKASIWSISEWEEIQIFGHAGINAWCSKKGTVLWGIHISRENKLTKIGNSVENSLYIAKFVCNHNDEWHGYPVHPKNNDIPPEEIIESWRVSKVIDKTDKRRIQRGKFRK